MKCNTSKETIQELEDVHKKLKKEKNKLKNKQEKLKNDLSKIQNEAVKNGSKEISNALVNGKAKSKSKNIPGFSDDNRSWLKPKQRKTQVLKENDESDEIDDVQEENEDSEISQEDESEEFEESSEEESDSNNHLPKEKSLKNTDKKVKILENIFFNL